MSHYFYYGRDVDGTAIEGSVNKTSENDVVNYLLKKNITPIKISLIDNKKSDNFLQYKALFLSKKVSDEDLVMFCRQMYTINKAGLPLIQGIESLSISVGCSVLKDCLVDIVHRLESGVSLSNAMKYHSLIFNSLFVGMVKIGESTGNLDKVFEQMGLYITRDIETKKALKSALRYPSFVLGAMIVALFVVNLMVIPAFSNMFSRFGAELPLPTQILLSTSHFFVHYWWLLIVGMAAAIVGSLMWVATPDGRFFWHSVKLQIPIVGDLIEKAAVSRYIRSFSLMLSAGLPLNKAIALCADVIGNEYLAKKIRAIKTDIEKGDSLYRTHMRSDMFSPLVLQMINVGENTGQVDALLMEVAESYERQVDYDLQSLNSKIEPLLILVMAGFVVVLALGIFLPMWDMFSIQQ